MIANSNYGAPFGFGRAISVMMEQFFRKNWLVVVGVGLGILGGLSYWYFIGCNSGSCAITSKPTNSAAYGGLMGGLIFSIFATKKETKK